MKIIRDNKVYVQNKDLVKTMQGSIQYHVGIPNEVVNKVFSDAFNITPENVDEFVTFEEKDSVDFFKKLPFIVDYDKAISLSERELLNQIRETMAVINGICSNYNKLLKNQTSHEYYRTMMTIDLLEHKFFDLRTILWAKKGKHYIKMPYELSDAYRLKMAFDKRRAEKQTK